MYELQSLAIIIVTAPLLGAIITGFFGKLLGKNYSHIIACSLIGLSFLLCSYVLYGFVTDAYQTWDYILYSWAKTGGLDISVGFLLDKLSVLMITIVTFVSLMVHIYSIGYMHDDPGYQRFFCYISLFTFAMLTLVMANNFMLLFFGWEAVGLVSYLLIGFWFTKPTAIYANLKAFIVNRIGDFGFILGIAAVLKYFGSLNYAVVFALAPSIGLDVSSIDLICMCLFVGAMAKSAQVPLHIWLPDSMEGPTPISALIHAATMVTAGVYMVARMSPLFEYSEHTLTFITIIGALTTLLMGMVAVVQTDIKRIIAYSTLSQLGYMVVALGVSAYAASILHLFTHAFFKSLLFLAAGSVILALHHQQDIFKMGNLRKYMPLTFATMLIGTLSMVGLPGMAGFYSKDLIIDAVHLSKLPGASFAYFVVLFSVLVTALYSFRLLFLVFYTKERMDSKSQSHIHESPKIITVPLILLALPAIIGGGILITPVLHGFFGSAIYVLPQHDVLSTYAEHDFHGAVSLFLHGFFTLPFILAVVGLVSAWVCYIKYPTLPQKFQVRFAVLNRILLAKFGFDWVNENIITPIIRKLSNVFWNVGDRLIIDGVMVNGTASGVRNVAQVLRKYQTGYLYNYALAMIVGLFLLLVWFFVLV